MGVTTKARTITNEAWLVMGDFNEILSQADKKGGGARNEEQIEAFRSSLEVCNLQPLDYQGNHFTWCRNKYEDSIKERLDWAMANEVWLNYFPNNSLTHLDFFHSDHRALLLCFKDPLGFPAQSNKKRKRFRFENMWIREPDCKDVVTANWKTSNQSALLSTISNIKQCSTNLTSWNQAKFGSLAKDIKETHQYMIHLHNTDDQDNKEELKSTEQKLNELLRKEEIFWKQRSRITWLKEGDQNTKFFHRRAKKRNKINTIKVKELKTALFSMSTDKSPGPDGMNAMFYRKYWDIIGPLFSKAILDCLNEEEDLDAINSTLVTLIPKVKEPRTVGDFRPISLCNVIYKVISKVLINRLKPILPFVINGTQSAFVPGRLITDNALIAYECLHILKQMKTGKRCYATMKMDMSKAYDRVEWIFIEKMLLKVGFPQQWVNKIMRCVTSVRYSFQINGTVYGDVRPTRGLRQGDPLSPYLFLICAEGFSALLRQAESRRDIMGLRIARNAPSISHLFFADDSLLFIKASDRSLQTIQEIFALYSECSGQMINFNKSILFFSPNTTEDTRSTFTRALNMQMTEAIENYLGLPMLGGKNKKILFRAIKDKVWVRLHTWKPDLFSQGGKEIMLKVVIQAMPTYVMSCFKIPEGVCQEIEKLMARYWWGSVQSKRRIHWRAWAKISIPITEGGLGFRKFTQYNQALLAKQAWRILICPTSLLSQVLKARYFPNSNFLESKEGSCPSLSWRSICWGKDLLNRGLRRRIGNGQSTKAFNDPWLPRPPSFRPITRGVNDERKVSEFILQPGRWNNEFIQQCFLSPDSQIILSIPLSPFNHSDSWLWHYNKNGNYTVKSGYNLAVSTDRSGPSSSTDVVSIWWKSLWATKIPRKILIFAWRGYHEILPTTKGLHRRNVTNHSNCPLCGFGEDSNAHAIFWCPLSQKVWTLMDINFLVGHKEDISFKEVLLYTTEMLGKEDFAKMLLTSWGIWLERNKRTHGQQQLRNPQQIKGWISLYYDDIKSSQSIEGETLITGNLARAGQVEVEVDSYTLYVDASISVGTQKVRLGAVIYSADKRIQAALSKPLEGTLSVLYAEALAMVVGLQWAQTSGLQVKLILSDSLSLVQALNNKVEYHNELGIFLSDITRLLLSYPGALVSHVRRNGNLAAHNLAKHALQLEEEESWMADLFHAH